MTTAAQANVSSTNTTQADTTVDQRIAQAQERQQQRAMQKSSDEVEKAKRFAKNKEKTIAVLKSTGKYLTYAAAGAATAFAGIYLYKRFVAGESVQEIAQAAQAVTEAV